MNTQLFKFGPDILPEISRILSSGGIVAIPTETVYGLAASAFDGRAVDKIFAAKGRPRDNPLIVHISDMSQLEGVVSEIPPQALLLAEKFWPGPLSIIMPKGEKIPDEVSCGLDTVAVRMPSSPCARAIISHCGLPLAAPSANLSGSPSPTSAKHVADDLFGRIDAIVDGGDCAVGVESTVISLCSEVPELLRPGGISLEQLREVLGEVRVSPAVLSQLEKGMKAASPGMKYKHYSPKTKVIILKGSFEKYLRFIHNKPRCAALCFDGEGEKTGLPFVEYGPENDSPRQGEKLFGALRDVDSLGVRAAYARYPRTDGVGLAVINRLLRAAAFTVIDLDGPVRIGVTGKTGAGKSTVCQLLGEKLDMPVIDCDRLARKVTEAGSPVLEKLAESFGEDILGPDGSLKRNVLAARAFSSKKNTALLNSITHPAVMELVGGETEKYSRAGKRGVILDAPQLFESGLDLHCHFTALVYAPKEVRLERILKRDGITAEEFEKRNSVQIDDEELIGRCDVLINNYGSFDLVAEAVKAVDAAEKYMRCPDDKN